MARGDAIALGVQLFARPKQGEAPAALPGMQVQTEVMCQLACCCHKRTVEAADMCAVCCGRDLGALRGRA